MKSAKAFAVITACIVCFALGYFINGNVTDKQLAEKYQQGFRDAVEELDEDYYNRLEKEKESSYQEGYNKGLQEASKETGNQSGVKYIEVPKFYSADQEEMYDEIWDEVYERAREDFEYEYNIDHDY